MKKIQTQVLVIGSGVAGLTAAMRLAEKGIETVVMTAASELTESNTVYAQGGIVFESSTHSSDKEKLIQDILEAGCHTNYLPAVKQLAEFGPKLVQQILIEKTQVPFDRTDKGELLRTREGGHSESRILYRGDESGKSIEEHLWQYCQTLPHIRFLTKTTAVNLLMTSHHGKDRSRVHEPAKCFGAFVFDQTSEDIYPIFAEHVVLATGGIGQLFLHNTNSRFSRGDGIALAERAGCRLANLEYVQFHPTTFYHPKSHRFLVSEAVRGEGAYLINNTGERFLEKYITSYATPELAPRDRVAKAIHQEMLSSGSPCVYLDIRHKSENWIQDRFPSLYRNCAKYGVNPAHDVIPVVPGAHYHCGGIWVNLEGQTSVESIWAVGEVSCTGLHGANRLASTSLLEGLVWADRAALAIIKKLQTHSKTEFPDIEPWQSESGLVDPSFLTQDWLTLKHTMWNYVGLIKTDTRLNRARGILNELMRGIEVFYQKAKLSDPLIGLRHSTLVAMRLLEACQANPKSHGCYLRETMEI